MTFLLGVVIIAVLTVVLLLFSIIEIAISQPSRLALRVLAERSADPRYELLEEIVRDRASFLLPIQYCNQLILVTISALTVALYFASGISAPLLFSLLTLGVLVSLFRQLIPRILSYSSPDKVILRILPSFRAIYRFLGWWSLPVSAVLALIAGSRQDRSSGRGRTGDTTGEEIQAYLEVGEEEGIFQSSETRLIQSALEFGNTSVREIMTPRSQIVAIEKEATFARLREVISVSKHSRIPVYSERIDQIVGVVHARSLLAEWMVGGDDGPITSMIKEILIVPETKKVSQLLKELQERAEQMAIVVNEYGTVSGLVTVEDLLEEIVGEIHDEHDPRRVEIQYDGAGSYIVRGSVEVDDLEAALGVDFGDHEAATVSGLVVDYLGRVPISGERIMLDGTIVEILNADQKRIHSLKVRLLSDSDSEN